MKNLEIGDLTIYPREGRVERMGKEVALTEKELKILELLVRSVGKPVTKSEISRLAIGRPLLPFDRIVDLHIASLKKKLGKLPDGRSLIKTVVGAGYLLQT